MGRTSDTQRVLNCRSSFDAKWYSLENRWVRCAARSLQRNAIAWVRLESVPLNPSPEGLVAVQIEVEDPVRPIDVIGGFDRRLIGVGVRSAELVTADTANQSGRITPSSGKGTAP
jgi:hypothetical protein